MLTKSFFLLFYFVLSSCISSVQEPDCNVSYKVSRSILVYHIENTGKNRLFIPAKYRVIKTRDSIVLEAYAKSNMIDYNQFIVPKMDFLLGTSQLTGKVDVAGLLSSDAKLFMRVFTEDFMTYIHDNKVKLPTENDFIDYEKKFSFLKEMRVSNKLSP